MDDFSGNYLKDQLQKNRYRQKPQCPGSPSSSTSSDDETDSYTKEPVKSSLGPSKNNKGPCDLSAKNDKYSGSKLKEAAQFVKKR